MGPPTPQVRSRDRLKHKEKPKRKYLNYTFLPHYYIIRTVGFCSWFRFRKKKPTYFTYLLIYLSRFKSSIVPHTGLDYYTGVYVIR
jgi:hypothetical protein